MGLFHNSNGLLCVFLNQRSGHSEYLLTSTAGSLCLPTKLGPTLPCRSPPAGSQRVCSVVSLVWSRRSGQDRSVVPGASAYRVPDCRVGLPGGQALSAGRELGHRRPGTSVVRGPMPARCKDCGSFCGSRRTVIRDRGKFRTMCASGESLISGSLVM